VQLSAKLEIFLQLDPVAACFPGAMLVWTKPWVKVAPSGPGLETDVWVCQSRTDEINVSARNTYIGQRRVDWKGAQAR
jgi:hypothetical protein